MGKFKPGDRVAYSAAFMRNIGPYASRMSHMQGTVMVVRHISLGVDLASIRWDEEGGARNVNVCNLEHVKTTAIRRTK